MEIQKSRHATHLLRAHLVFVTKYRYNILTGEHIEYLRTVFKETMEEMGGTLEEFDGERNHVHSLIQYPPKWAISVIVNNLKGRSSRLLRRDLPDVKKDIGVTTLRCGIEAILQEVWAEHLWKLSSNTFSSETRLIKS